MASTAWHLGAVGLRRSHLVGLTVSFVWLAACASTPSSEVPRLLEEARAARERGDRSEARRCLDAVSEPSAEVDLVRAELDLGEGRWFEAAHGFHRAKARGLFDDALEFTAAIGLGEAALGGGDVREAELWFREARTLAPTPSSRALVDVGLARAEARSGRRDAARHRAASIPPGTPGLDALSSELSRGMAEVHVSAAADWRPSWTPRAPHVSQRLATAPAPIAATAVVARERWGARPARRSELEPMGRVTRITVHHTGEEGFRQPRSYDEALDRMRSLQATHQQRWADVGYHFLIDAEGRIYAGREVCWQGAHAGNGAANRGNLGIALFGNFDDERPTRVQLRSLESLARSLCHEHGLSPRSIEGHDTVKKQHGLSGTSCPGRHLEVELQRLRDALAADLTASR